jgi:hypothetical protein
VRSAEGRRAVARVPSVGSAIRLELATRSHVHASREVVACSKQYMPMRPRLFSSPRVPPVRLFPCSPVDWLIDRPRSVNYVPVQSSIKRTLLQSSFSFGRRFALSRSAATYLGLCPPPDITASLPTMQSVPPLYWRRPRCSQPFDGFRHAACEPVSSRSRVQDSFSFRGLSTPCSLQPSSDWFRPCRSTRARSPASRLPRSRASTPTFCSTRGRSPPVRCLASPAVCSPLRVSCSSRFTWCQRGQLPALERSCRYRSAFSLDLRRGLVRMPRRSTSAHFRPQTWMPRLQSALPARAFGPSTLTCQKAKRAWSGSRAVD